jgi:hypothetical protein
MLLGIGGKLDGEERRGGGQEQQQKRHGRSQQRHTAITPHPASYLFPRANPPGSDRLMVQESM